MTAGPARDRSQDTAPQPVVDLPVSPAQAARALGDVSSVLLIRAVVAAGGAVLLLVAAALLFAHGVRPNTFPGYLAGSSRTLISRYSGPWIGAAAGAALLGGLSLTSCGADLFRRGRLLRAYRSR